MSHELSFDGCGINTRLATFATPRGDDARKFGPLFAASPDMLAALTVIIDRLEAWAEYSERIARTEADSPRTEQHKNIAANYRELIRIARDSMPKP